MVMVSKVAGHCDRGLLLREHCSRVKRLDVKKNNSPRFIFRGGEQGADPLVKRLSRAY
jgi:hypothetical protein